jgi:hypothetical protein
VTKPNHVVLKPLDLVCGRLWESLEKPDTEVLECCKQSLITSSGGSSDRNVNRNAYREGQTPEVSGRKLDWRP